MLLVQLSDWLDLLQQVGLTAAAGLRMADACKPCRQIACLSQLQPGRLLLRGAHLSECCSQCAPWLSPSLWSANFDRAPIPSSSPPGHLLPRGSRQPNLHCTFSHRLPAHAPGLWIEFQLTAASTTWLQSRRMQPSHPSGMPLRPAPHHGRPAPAPVPA